MTKMTRQSYKAGATIVASPQARSTDRAVIREDAPEDTDSDLLIETSWGTPVKVLKASERADDPVRLYLREIGSVDLLSREGEVAIAKRIEAGRRAMIAGLCESPLTFQAIVIWRDELNDGKVFLRDIIDLEATYAGPDAKQVQPPVIGPDGKPIVPQPGAPTPFVASAPTAPAAQQHPPHQTQPHQQAHGGYTQYKPAPRPGQPAPAEGEEGAAAA